MRPSLTGPVRTRLDARALYFVSYDGLVNTNSFQKHGLLTHGRHQYAVWYTASREAVVARRELGTTAWSAVTLPHRLKADDSHNVICMGVSPVDGRLHLNLDSHSDGFHYVKSVAGLLDDTSRTAWGPSAFGTVRTTLDGLPLTARFTYPQFLTTPEGLLQLAYRTGVSGNGRNALAEYDGSRWTALGEWSGATGTYTSAHGSSTARSMYLHGLDYDRRGRLHALFTWRERDPAVLADGGGLTNHDTGYVTSDDRGRTWRNDAGAVVG
ncbi:BNR repeat-containing protein, partial [Streptomyces sp. WELS2]|uniref:BNR repeat-containing protein n=1 Tax=Streptomyces sp. WELS2 TaxID=2749435 RepID=UPI0015F0F89D